MVVGSLQKLPLILWAIVKLPIAKGSFEERGKQEAAYNIQP
jgi:hypothetical protein